MLDYRFETFLTLCECLNYHKAAEILHISQPAVTMHIQYLEKQYGCRLFTYENHILKKTDQADRLEKYARSVKMQDYMMRERLVDGSRQKLRVGATKTIGDYFLQENICEYLGDQNNELTFIVDNTVHLLTYLENNELDFVVVEGFFDKERYDSILLRREPFVGICSESHPFANREVMWNELMAETIIHREEGSGTRAILEQKLNSHNESLDRFKRRITISSFKLILNLVKMGYGISFVYDILAKSEPGIAKFSILGEPIVREFNIVFLKNTNIREKIRAFMHV